MKIYVVNRNIGLCPPSIEEYEGIEIRITGASVRQYGGKRFIPAAEGRSFYESKSTALAAMQTFAMDKIDSLLKIEKQLRAITENPQGIRMLKIPHEMPETVKL
jgi:hypothetical protein